jgi:DNA-binding LacI/PurR family transcriptional regulator
MNIEKIAQLAKVSTATVSRTVNGSYKVTPETAEKVWRVVRSLGYQPNSYARALVSGRSRMLGLIISDIVNPFFPELVRSFEEIALANGYEVILANTGYDPERMARSVSRMLERQVEGVAVITSEMGKDFVARMSERQIPIVFLDTARIGPRISKICVDYAQGIREAVEHIVGLGHKRIAFISGPPALRTAETRRTAFLKCLHKFGALPDKALLQTGNHRIDGGQAANTPHRRPHLERSHCNGRAARASQSQPSRARRHLRSWFRRHRAQRIHASGAHHCAPLAQGSGRKIIFGARGPAGRQVSEGP